MERNYKNKSKAEENRALRTHRRSLDQKANRLDQANKRRNLKLLEPVDENVSHTSTSQDKGAKKGKDPMERLEQLKKWKEQKMLRKKIEAQKKKPVFKVSVMKPEAAPFKKGAAPHPTIKSTKPPARKSEPSIAPRKSEPNVAVPARRVTRSSSVSDPKTATTSRAAPKRSSAVIPPKTTIRAPATNKTTVKTASKPPPSTRTTSRVSSARTEKSPPKRTVRRSTRTSSRSGSVAESEMEVNSRHITKRTQEKEEEDDLVFQYAPSDFVFEFQPMEAASMLFPDSDKEDRSATPRTRKSIRLSTMGESMEKSAAVEESESVAHKEPETSQEMIEQETEIEQTKSEEAENEQAKSEEIMEANKQDMPIEEADDVFNEEPKKSENQEVNHEEIKEKVDGDNQEQPMETQESQEQVKDAVPQVAEVEHNGTPQAVQRTRKSCGDALRTPYQAATSKSALRQRRSMSVPAKSTPLDRKVAFRMPATTPGELVLSSKRLRRKDLRRSTTLRGLSPEECVIVLSCSPMIEMERRPYKGVKAPVAQLDFDDDEIDSIIKEQDSGVVNEKKPEVAESTPKGPESETAAENKETEPTLPTETAEKETENAATEGDKTTQGSPPVHDVPYFRNLLVSETNRLNVFCDKWNEINDNTAEISDEVRGQIRTTVGQAHLLMSQRFKQFSGLVDNCEFKTGEKETTFTDLDGFWEMIYIQVEDVDCKFNKLDKLRENNWREEKPIVKKKVIKKNPVTKGVKGPAKPAARSKFAEFRAKMLQQKKQEEEPKKEEEKTDVEETSETKLVADEPVVKDEDTKTFDAGFFKVSSPVQSPKFHCESGSPRHLSGRRSKSRTSLAAPCGSPMLKSVLDKSARRMSRSNPNSPISGASIAMRLSRSNPGSPMHIANTAVDLSSAVTSLRQEVLTKQLASAWSPSIFSPDTNSQTPQSTSSIRRSSRRRTIQHTPAESANKNSPGAQNQSTDVDFMAYLLPSAAVGASPSIRAPPSERQSLSSMEAEDGPQVSPLILQDTEDTENIPQESPQVQDVDMAPPSKVSLTEEFLNMPSSAGKAKRARSIRLSSGRRLSQSERRKSRSAIAKRHSVRFTSSTTSEDTSPLARMPLTPFNRDYAGPKAESPAQEEVFLFTPPTENATPRRGNSTTPATRMSKLSFKSPHEQTSSPASSIYTPRRSTRRSVAASDNLITFS